MAAVVHHGGAGTTSAGLTVGIPSIVVPFTMEQPFWAERVCVGVFTGTRAQRGAEYEVLPYQRFLSALWDGELIR